MFVHVKPLSCENWNPGLSPVVGSMSERFGRFHVPFAAMNFEADPSGGLYVKLPNLNLPSQRTAGPDKE